MVWYPFLRASEGISEESFNPGQMGNSHQSRRTRAACYGGRKYEPPVGYPTVVSLGHTETGAPHPELRWKLLGLRTVVFPGSGPPRAHPQLVDEESEAASDTACAVSETSSVERSSWKALWLEVTKARRIRSFSGRLYAPNVIGESMRR